MFWRYLKFCSDTEQDSVFDFRLGPTPRRCCDLPMVDILTTVAFTQGNTGDVIFDSRSYSYQ